MINERVTTTEKVTVTLIKGFVDLMEAQPTDTNFAECPRCKRKWIVPCEQSKCIELYKECMCCRFIPHGKINLLGSASGTEDELKAITEALKIRETFESDPANFRPI